MASRVEGMLAEGDVDHQMTLGFRASRHSPHCLIAKRRLRSSLFAFGLQYALLNGRDYGIESARPFVQAHDFHTRVYLGIFIEFRRDVQWKQQKVISQKPSGKPKH